MTTIAANLECMAADTRVSIDGSAHYHTTKLFRVGDSIFGTAGDGMMCLVMIDWLRGKDRKRSTLYANWTEHTERSACWLLELNPKGLFVWDGWGIPEPLIDKRYAIGSGQVAALRGMDLGQSPEDAVKAAPDYDQYSGAPVQVEWLLPPELKRKR
jgi:hypothetical protein